MTVRRPPLRIAPVLDSYESFVVGFMVDDMRRVVLLRKAYPPHMAGRLTGIGGLLEPGESVLEAMHREWGEETGDDTAWPWHRFATQLGARSNVHFCIARVVRLPKLPAFNDAGEGIEVRQLSSVLTLLDGAASTFPNVPWLLWAAVVDPLPKLITISETQRDINHAEAS